MAGQRLQGVMARFPYTVFSKFGVAATFILGAVVGDRIRRHRQLMLQTVENDDVNEDKTKFSSIDEKHNRFISKIYKGLQMFSSNTTNATSSLSTAITKFYTEVGRVKCEHYLAMKGQLSHELDQRLEDWLTLAENTMNAGELWIPLPSQQIFKPPSYNETLLSGIRALWYLSYNKEFTRAFNGTDLVETLCEAVEEQNDLIIPLILKIFANMAVNQESHMTLKNAGVLNILTHCANSENSRMFLPAWRALHNYESKETQLESDRVVYPEGVYPYVMPGETKDADIDIILVHGISGGAEWTFRQHDSALDHTCRPPLPQNIRKSVLDGDSKAVDHYYTWCWPLDWLSPALPKSARILAVNYESHWMVRDSPCYEESESTISERSRELHDALRAAGVGKKPIVWLAHSMGGLLVKHMMSACDSELGSHTVAVMFLSVPHHGSPLATTAASRFLQLVLRPTKEVLEMSIDNPELADVHQSFIKLVKEYNVAVLTLNETEPTRHKPSGYDFHFVPSKFGDPAIGKFYEVNATHRDICKPHNRDSEVFQRVFTFLQSVLKKL